MGWRPGRRFVITMRASEPVVWDKLSARLFMTLIILLASFSSDDPLTCTSRLTSRTVARARSSYNHFPTVGDFGQNAFIESILPGSLVSSIDLAFIHVDYSSGRDAFGIETNILPTKTASSLGSRFISSAALRSSSCQRFTKLLILSWSAGVSTTICALNEVEVSITEGGHNIRATFQS